MAPTIELGLDTFGDATVDAEGKPLSQAQAIRDVVKQGELADQVGLAFIGVGEHHRPDFSVSAPEVVLAAIAARTTRIHLGSAVTVLSTDDPVRVFERVSTLNAISNGRAEIIVGLPLMLAIIGGSPARFAPHARLYREQLERFGKPAQPIGAHSPGHVAATDEQAKEELWPHYAALMNRIGAERGWAPIGRDHFEREARHGALFVGSPPTVAAKILSTVKTLGLSRFDLKYANGTMPHDKLVRSIELYGTQVVPLVRDALG